MFSKLQVALALLSLTTYAAAGTTVLGTASARGPIRVDGYAVQGNATVFAGSVVETQDASADLRVAHGVNIKLSKSSAGTVYGDHFTLKRGETEVSDPGSFALEANGLRVTAKKPHSVGIVLLTPKHAVEVAALSGSFEVRDGRGSMLSSVLPGQPRAFSRQPQVDASQTQAPIAAQFLEISGLISSSGGHYYLTSDSNVLYELIGNTGRFQKFVGDKVDVSGQFKPVSLPGGAVGTIDIKTMRLHGGGTVLSRKDAWIITGAALAGAGTVGFVVHNALNPAASR